MRRAAFLIVVLAALAAPASASAACRPTAAHPYPVILVHGTFANQALSWNALRPLLEADGFCVFSLDYGNNATAPDGAVRQHGGRLRAPGPGPDRRGQGVLRRALPGRLARPLRGQGQGPAGPDGRRRRPRALEPRHHLAVRGPGGAARVRGVPRPAGRLALHEGAQRAARGAGAGELHRGLDPLRRGRHALPVAGAEREHGDERRAAEPLPGRPHRARRDHLRPRGAAVGARRAAAYRARQPGLRPGLLGTDDRQ